MTVAALAISACSGTKSGQATQPSSPASVRVAAPIPTISPSSERTTYPFAPGLDPETMWYSQTDARTGIFFQIPAGTESKQSTTTALPSGPADVSIYGSFLGGERSRVPLLYVALLLISQRSGASLSSAPLAPIADQFATGLTRNHSLRVRKLDRHSSVVGGHHSLSFELAYPYGVPVGAMRVYAQMVIDRKAIVMLIVRVFQPRHGRLTMTNAIVQAWRARLLAGLQL